MSKKAASKQKARAEPTQKRSAMWLCTQDAYDVLTTSGYTRLDHNPEMSQLRI